MNKSSIISTNNNDYLANIKNGIASCSHKVTTIYSKPFHAPNNLVERLEDNCAICLFPIIINDRKIALLENCKHIYHAECINKCLENPMNDCCCICTIRIIAEYEYNSAFEFIYDELDYCNQPSCDNNNKTKVKKYAITKFDLSKKIKDRYDNHHLRIIKRYDKIENIILGCLGFIFILVMFWITPNDQFSGKVTCIQVVNKDSSVSDLCWV